MAEGFDIEHNDGVCVALVGFGAWLIKREKTARLGFVHDSPYSNKPVLFCRK